MAPCCLKSFGRRFNSLQNQPGTKFINAHFSPPFVDCLWAQEAQLWWRRGKRRTTGVNFAILSQYFPSRQQYTWSCTGANEMDGLSGCSSETGVEGPSYQLFLLQGKAPKIACDGGGTFLWPTNWIATVVKSIIYMKEIYSRQRMRLSFFLPSSFNLFHK